MKLLLPALLIVGLSSNLHAQSQPKPDDIASFQASIMAFGVSADIANQAAKKAIKHIEQKRTTITQQTTTEAAFANISDDLINDPFGF